MNAGSLRHRCWLLTPTHAGDGYGTVTTTWGTATVCWGSLEPLRGREWIESGMENSEISARFRMRYFAGVAPTMRLSFGSRTFEIVAVLDAGERHRELELMLKELVVA